MGNITRYLRDEDKPKFYELSAEAQLYCKDKKTGKPPGVIQYMIHLIFKQRGIKNEDN